MTAFIPRKGTVTEFFDTKTKKFAKPFLPVHFGPRSNLLSQKNGQKSCDTVPCNAERFLMQSDIN